MKEHEYSVIFPDGNTSNYDQLIQASQLIGHFALQGLVLEISPEKLADLASQKSLVLAVSGGEVVGTAAVTFVYPDGKKEFGGWAVQESWQKHGVGLALLAALVEGQEEDQLVAFGNANSGPIFEKLGATKINHQAMHESAFEPCKTCKCHGKETLAQGQKCMDTIYDLTPVILAMIGKGE